MNAFFKDLAVTTAQEIRNPLTSIKGLLQLTAEKKTIEENHLRIIFDEINKVSQTIDDFLLLTKTPQLSNQPYKINLLIEDIFLLYKTLFEKQNIKLLKNLTPQKISSTIDQNQFYQAIINIIENAMLAMPDGGILTVVTRQAGHSICLEFTNTGTGIYSPFLISAYYILHRYKGTLEFKSEKGRWSTVRVYLPAI